MSNRGGKREGAGRPAGATNKVNREIKELAAQFDELAVDTLAEIAKGDTGSFDDDGNAVKHPASSRVAAAVALLDRAHGKPSQATEISATVAIRLEDWIGTLK